MPIQPKAEPWNQFPRDDSLGTANLQCLDWIVTQLNQQVGQAAVPPSSGIEVYGQNIIDPTNGADCLKRQSNLCDCRGYCGSYDCDLGNILFYLQRFNVLGEVRLALLHLPLVSVAHIPK